MLPARERVKRVMAETFGLTAEEILDDSAIDEFKEWDSLSHLALMLALENEFSVHISTAAMLELFSLGAIEHYLQDEASV